MKPNPSIEGVRYQITRVSSNEDKVTVERYDYVLDKYEDIHYTHEAYSQSIGFTETRRKKNLDVEKCKDKLLVEMDRVDVKSAGFSATKAVYGNLWVFEVNLPNIGDTKPKHKHEFDHMHLIVQGKAKLTVFDEDGAVMLEEVFTAPEWIKIPRHHIHTIEALVDDTVGYCIHPMRNKDDEIIDSDYLDSYKVRS